MKKWNRKLGTSKREQGIITPKMNGKRLPQGWSHRIWKFKELVKKLLRNNPRWHK